MNPPATHALSGLDAISSLLLVLSAAFLASVGLTPSIRDRARGRGWLDRPDGRRKMHADAVPRLGGLAVYLSFLLAFLAAVTLLPPSVWLGASGSSSGWWTTCAAPLPRPR
jgi:UDP-GlcNAc:undecaprenyl-phosphate GlcNAc-1-phosphate transferase